MAARKIFRIERLPLAFVQAFAMMLLSAVWLWCFGQFWNYMVVELPKDLGPYSQMNSLSMFLHRAFPMRETNDIAFEYKFDHIIILANVMVLLMMGWVPSRYDVKKAANKGKKKGK